MLIPDEQVAWHLEIGAALATAHTINAVESGALSKAEAWIRLRGGIRRSAALVATASVLDAEAMLLEELLHFQVTNAAALTAARAAAPRVDTSSEPEGTR